MINNVNIDHAVKFFQEYFAVMQVIKVIVRQNFIFVITIN